MSNRSSKHGNKKKNKNSCNDQLRIDREQRHASSWLFCIYLYIILPIAESFYQLSVEGIENLSDNPKEPILYITFHSYHSIDIFLGLILLYKKTGKVVIALVHRIVMIFLFMYRSMGCIPGHREEAIKLLKRGHSCAVIPGGGEEGMLGYENAYKIHWYSNSGRKRMGWAHVVKESNCKVIPIAGKHTQEMFFCPISYLWNKCGLSHWYTSTLISLPGIYGWIFFQIALSSWLLINTFFSIPIPVKAGLVVGKPLIYQPNETVEQFTLRAEIALQELTTKANPNGLCYVQAIKERFSFLNSSLKIIEKKK